MAANFQQIGGTGQMMPQLQQLQQQGQQQRPNQNTNSPAGQIHQIIFQTLNNNTPALTGWQSDVLIQERISLIFNIIGNLRLASQNQPNPPPLQKMIEIGMKFEKDIFEKSADKDEYKGQLHSKLDQLLERRALNQANLQQSLQIQAQAQAHAQQAAQAQQVMMNQNNLQGQVSRTMSQQPAQQGFHHLQHQMQASPIPGQQPQRMPIGIPNEAMAPNITQHQHQQFQLSMQHQHQQLQHPPPPQQQQQQQPQNASGRPQNSHPQLTAADNAIITELANRLMATSTPEEKAQIRLSIQTRIDPQTLQRYQQQGIDPITMYFRQQAVSKFRAERAARMQSQAQPNVSQQQPQTIPTTAPPMQQQRSMNPSPLNGQVQPPTSIGANPDFGFVGNMGNLVDQQQQGVMAQEAGQMVVPVSGIQRISTPQPGGMTGPGHQMSIGDQRAVPNPNIRTQQQQQMFNVQHSQQQRMQHAAQQQSQAVARANAQSKAQQIALQGQPGGMSSGPMPPQQSPAMATLNAPLRTPSQQMNPETPQMNANGQFGQPLDPRFIQGNPRSGTSGPYNPAMLAAMPPDQQQRLVGLPPEKLNDVVNRWHEQRAQHMNAASAQSVRPPVPIQGNNQFRPGQVPQSNQFNPQNALSQFMNQRPPQSIANNLTPQQQQIMLHQQMARFNQQNSNQPRQSPQNMTPAEQRTIMQMDNMDFPTGLLNHAHMPRNIPQEIKKWGALKQWAQGNPALAPDAFDHIKSLQKVHYQQIVRMRNQQAGQPQPIGTAGSGQADPGTATMVPPGMSAPVAPMGQNSMPIPNGINIGPGQIRQPTPQDVQAARNHPSGKMANLTDDHIRTILIKNQMNNLNNQQQQRQMIQQIQMTNNHISQMNGPQQSRPGMQAQTGNLMGAAQIPLGQAPQGKQPQSTSELPLPASNALNNNRSNRVPPNGRDVVQNSSPAPPSRNLKRASSDDVVEVPNPHTQPQRVPPQQNQTPKPASQQIRQLTAQQLAQLDPEARKKYEQTLRMSQPGREQSNIHLAKLKSIMDEEALKSREVLPDIPMDQETRSRVAVLLRDMHAPLNNMVKAIPKWYAMTRDDNRAREFLRTRYRLMKQYKDGEMKEPKSTFSMSLTQAEEALQLLRGMVQDLSDRFPTLKRQDAAQPHSEHTAPQAAAQNTQTAIPLNVANLQQHQQQLKQTHQRTVSRNAQTPAAPTSSQPPFPFGGGSSPHGTPSYIGKSAVTQENLQLPARKKVKQNNNSSGPGQNSSISNVPQTKSPDIKRQQLADSKQQQKSSLCCREPDCERHNSGFDSQEALDRHTQDEHVGPLQDPKKYALENLAFATNLDLRGRAKKHVDSVALEPIPTASAKITSTGSRQERTPKSSAEVSTPMNRQSSTTGTKLNLGSKNDLLKSGADEKDSNKQTTPPTQALSAVDPWANTTIDPTDLIQAFHGFDAGAPAAISDRNIYRSITPNDTPESSKDGVSEPNSDISEGVGLDINIDLFDENWQPFGAGDIDSYAEMGNYNIGDEDIDIARFDAERPPVDLQSWDDMIDFDNPFTFDTSMYSMGE